MIRKLFLLAFILAFISIPLTAQMFTGTLGVTFTGIRNPDGHIAIGLFGKAENWPYKPFLELQFSKEQMNKNGTLTAEVKDLPAGTYAIALLDDENDNLEMDMFLGIPNEGFGFSNNPPLQLSEPPFDDCCFNFDGISGQLGIDLRYIGKSGKKKKKGKSR